MGSNENNTTSQWQRRASLEPLFLPSSFSDAADDDENDRRRPRSANFSPIRRRGSQSSTDNNRIRRLSRTVSAIDAVLALLGSDVDDYDQDEDEDMHCEQGQARHRGNTPRS